MDAYFGQKRDLRVWRIAAVLSLMMSVALAVTSWMSNPYGFSSNITFANNGPIVEEEPELEEPPFELPGVDSFGALDTLRNRRPPPEDGPPSGNPS